MMFTNIAYKIQTQVGIKNKNENAVKKRTYLSHTIVAGKAM